MTQADGSGRRPAEAPNFVSMLVTEDEKRLLARVLEECRRQREMDNDSSPLFWATLLGKLHGDFCRSAFEKEERKLPSGKSFRSITRDTIQLAAAAMTFLLQGGVPKDVEISSDYYTG